MKRKKKKSFRAEKIGDFFKTEHFLERQWERKISDKILIPALQKVKPTNDRQCIIISQGFLPSTSSNRQELFVIVDQKTLVTCFFESITVFREQNTCNCKYILIN